MAFQTSDERNQWLSRYLGIYNGRRCHMAVGGIDVDPGNRFRVNESLQQARLGRGLHCPVSIRLKGGVNQVDR